MSTSEPGNGLINVDPHAGRTRKSSQEGTAYDADGRRRIVLSGADQRTIDRAIKILTSVGLGAVIGCRSRTDGKKPCGQVLLLEGVDPTALPGQRVSADAGYGCECTRLHYTEGAVRG